jgi:hypothetical protein
MARASRCKNDLSSSTISSERSLGTAAAFIIIGIVVVALVALGAPGVLIMTIYSTAVKTAPQND